MDSLLIALGFFLAGLVIGSVTAAMVLIRCRAPFQARIFEQLLAEQGYTIRDGRIVRVDEEAK